VRVGSIQCEIGNGRGERKIGRRASETRRGRAYVSRRQRRGALMGADAGSDWVSARLTRAHPLLGIPRFPVRERGIRRTQASAGGSDGTLPPLVLQHIFLA